MFKSFLIFKMRFACLKLALDHRPNGVILSPESGPSTTERAKQFADFVIDGKTTPNAPVSYPGARAA